MQSAFAAVLSLARLTLHDPQAAARVILGLNLPANARWTAAAVTMVLAAIMMTLLSAVIPTEGEDLPVIAPFFWVALTAIGMMITTGLVYQVGRWFGGKGNFADTLVLMAWLQFMQVGIAVAQFIALILLPVLGGMIDIASLIITLWLLTAFVTELHGFSSTGKVFGGIALTFGVAVIALTALVILGSAGV